MGLHWKFSCFFPATVGWGVAILLKNLLELKIHDEVKDTLGNYIIRDV